MRHMNVNVLYGDMCCKQLNVPTPSVCENVVNVLIVGIRKLLLFFKWNRIKIFISRIKVTEMTSYYLFLFYISFLFAFKVERTRKTFNIKQCLPCILNKCIVGYMLHILIS